MSEPDDIAVDDEDDSEAAPAGGVDAASREDAADEPPRRFAPRLRGGRMPSGERLYIVAYDIADPKRWRRVFRTMKGYGRWLQLSVFQCRLSGRRRADLGAALDRLIHHTQDHVVILDLGPADEVDPRVESIGKSFAPIVREAVIV
jgi:CRISPR-associated protein Cas2